MDRIPAVNATDRWTIRSRARPGDTAGTAAVTFTLTNEAHGTFPDFTLHVDWKPGVELADAEAFAAWLLAQSLTVLGQDLMDHGRALSQTGGQPGGQRGG